MLTLNSLSCKICEHCVISRVKHDLRFVLHMCHFAIAFYVFVSNLSNAAHLRSRENQSCIFISRFNNSGWISFEVEKCYVKIYMTLWNHGHKVLWRQMGNFCTKSNCLLRFLHDAFYIFCKSARDSCRYCSLIVDVAWNRIRY